MLSVRLKTLYAIHVVTAESLGGELSFLVTDDRRLAMVRTVEGTPCGVARHVTY